jgi:acyl-CoA thioesterase FadM
MALRVQRETAENFDCVATRVWTLLEAGKKAYSRRVFPEFSGSLGGPWLSFKAADNGQTREFISVVTHPLGKVARIGVEASNELELTRPSLAVVGIAVTVVTRAENVRDRSLAATTSRNSEVNHLGLPDQACYARKTMTPPGRPAQNGVLDRLLFARQVLSVDADFSGPEGQPVFIKTFPVTFKACQTPSKKVDFSNYFGWMGELREYASLSLSNELRRSFETGRLGASTNFFNMEVFDEVGPGDVIEERLWQGLSYGVNNEGHVLKCEWRKLDPKGGGTRIAYCEMGFSWVRILGHGIAAAVQLPEYAQVFIDDLLPKKGVIAKPSEERSSRFARLNLGDLIWQKDLIGEGCPLFSHDIATTSVNSNWVGNVYFAYFGEWMSQVRDLFFHRLTPDDFKCYGKAGEWVCLDCSIQYLSEAMPYDVIRVDMRITAIHCCGVKLSFDYFLLEDCQPSRKLAHGKHTMAWMGRDARSEPVLLKVPQNVLETLLDSLGR